MNRIERLKGAMSRAAHVRHRIELPAAWNTCDMPVSMPERKAHGLQRILENMPIAIEEDELLVGTRTVYEVGNDGGWTHNSFPVILTEQERKQKHTGPRASHNVGGYRKVLDLGFGGVRSQALDRLASESDQRKRAFLASVGVAFDAATAFVMRYALLAEEMAGNGHDQRRKELERIAEVCRHIATEPPRDLYEALQLCWFTHLIFMIENMCLMSLGRLDQYLEPYWSTCSPAEAQELLACFFIKLNDQTDVWCGEGHTSNNIMLAGIRPDGSDGTNKVTYACLDALDALRMPEPLIAVRLHRNSPEKLVQRTCALNASGLGQISFYNDDTFIPALERGGIPAESARDYALDACQDVLIDGCSTLFCPSSYTFHSLTNICNDAVKASRDCESFDALMQEFKVRFKDRNREFRELHAAHRSIPTVIPMPFTSGTLSDCIEMGKDLGQGGARFSDRGVYINSPVNAINSMAAIKKVVFEDKVATLSDIIDALDTDYQGHESLRQRLLAAPKWGNDDDEVDLIAKEMLESVCYEVQAHETEDGVRYLSGIHQAHHVTGGAGIGATADGRRAGEPLPVTLSPVNGTDKGGPTAIMRSMTKLDPMIFQWNCALGLDFNPAGLRSPEGNARYASLVKTYLSLGGPQLQCNFVDVDTLRAAQREPGQYSGLVVRIWGFCARFIDLSPAYQDELIERTRHTL